MQQIKAVILGAGLAGWSLVDHLIAQGWQAQDIALVDIAQPGSGSSGVLRGMLHPFTGRTLYYQPEAYDNWRYARQWLDKLQALTDETLWQDLPLWRITTNADTEAQFKRSFIRAQRDFEDYPLLEIAAESLPLAEIRSAYAFEPASWANLSALLDLLSKRYPVGHFQQAPIKIQKTRSGWQVRSREQTWLAENLILCHGTSLLAHFPNLPFRLKRGEVAHIRMDTDIEASISGGGRYLCPLGQGEYLAGATFYYGDHPWPAEVAWQDLKDRFGWLPQIHQAQLKAIWSGLRVTIHPDRQPLLGPIPEQDKLYVMSAFSTRGLLQIPRSALLLADLLVHGNNHLPKITLPARLKAEHWQASGLDLD